MIRIDVIHNNNNIKQIILKGHADYEEYGKDIVCAAVSATFLCTVNAILAIDEEAIQVISQKEEQVIDVMKEDRITQTLLHNMLKCLENLEEQYPKNIKIR